MNFGFPIRFTGLAEVVSVPRRYWDQFYELSQRGDPSAQAELDCFLRRYGHVTARTRSRNLITDTGLNVAGQLIFPSGKWFILAKGTGAPANANTMASHSPWAELTTYTQATRPPLTMGTWTSGSANNSAALGIYTAPSGGLTFFGWGIVDNSTKGGNTGNLISVADHSASQAIPAGNALRQAITATVARGP